MFACWDQMGRCTAVVLSRGGVRRQGVARYGVGRWREILTARELEGRFDAVRTGVDLKVPNGSAASPLSVMRSPV